MTAIKSDKEKSFNLNTSAIKQTLLSRLQESNNEKDFFTPDNVKSLKDLPEFSLEEKEVYNDRDIEEQLSYILDPVNNIKKEYQKAKMTNSCKCAKTGCSKYSCNCLRNRVACDFLCSCKNCENKENTKPVLLKKKSLRGEK